MMIKNSVLMLAISSVFLSACNNSPVSTVNIPEPTKVKNLILMIGDGMGPQQVGLLEEYAQRAPLSIYNDKGNKQHYLSLPMQVK